MKDQISILSLGSNSGKRMENLRTAVGHVDKIAGILNISSIYETKAMGITEQSNFYNLVAMVSTDLSAVQLLEKLLEVEVGMGRIRRVKWGPRNIDIDIIFHNGEIIDSPGITIPHAQYHNRNFVMIPLLEILPEFVCPSRGAVKAVQSAAKDPGHILRQINIRGLAGFSEYCSRMDVVQV